MKKSMRRTEEEKKIFLEKYFCYEVNMFLDAYNLMNNSTITRNKFFNNIIIESIALRARNLTEFFYNSKSKTRAHYARVSDFFDNENNWDKIKTERIKIINFIQNRINNEVTHLTYKRLDLTPLNSKWKTREIYKELLNTIKIFLEYLPEKYLGNRLRKLQGNIEKMILQEHLTKIASL